jgi:tetratricopeptide (TPR) repeat protein
MKQVIAEDNSNSEREFLVNSADRESLAHASVLIELGWYHDAEREIVDAMDAQSNNLTALSLFAKVKHIRGELSQAIACWAQLYTHSPESRRASTHLAALLHLADDPERSAAEFIALSSQPLAQKPAGPLALEEAFRLFSAHRLEEAHQRAEEVAAKYRHEDRPMYKLATLADAWISELSGDIAGACDILEAMGRERGFETDDDRLLALARLYEKKNTEDRIQGAVKIYQYLEEKNGSDLGSLSPLLSHLSSLHQRLGDNDEARTYARRYLALYRQRMHRPSFDDAIKAASQRYLSLHRLSTLPLWSGETGRKLSDREGALAHALKSRRAEARAVLEHGTDVLDKKYLADLARLDGDVELAFELYLKTLDEDPDDLQVIGYLLESHASKPHSAIASYFREPAAFTRTRRNLEDAIREAPLRPSLWGQLAALQAIIKNTREADSCRQRASELAAAARQRNKPVGRALSASVYHFIGRAHGLIHEIWTHRDPVGAGMGGVLPSDHILGNVTAEMKEGIRNTFFAVREYARTKFPRRTADLFDFNYTFKVPKEDEPSGGLSAGLPAALAFLSVFLQRPIPQTLASSGILVADAHDVLTIRRVGEAEHKVDAAYHRNLRALILPRENAGELQANPRVPSEICEELVHYVSSVDEAVKLVFGDNIFLHP